MQLGFPMRPSFPARNGGRKGNQAAELISTSDTHSNGTAGFPCGHCHSGAGVYAQLCGSRCSRRSPICILHTLQNVFTVHTVHPKILPLIFLIWSVISNWTSLKQNAFQCLQVLQSSFAGTSSPKPPPPQSWMQTREVWIFLLDLKDTLELRLLKCRFMKETKIVVTCVLFIYSKTFNGWLCQVEGYTPSSWGAPSLLSEDNKKTGIVK